VRWLQLEDGDRVLLCSDGLSDMVEDTTIAGCLLQHPEPDAAAIALTQMALRNGGKDNITVVVAQYTIPKPGEAQPPLEDTADHPDQAPVDSTSEFPFPTEDFVALQ